MALFQDSVYRGNEDDATATTTIISASITCAAIITCTNSIVKTVLP